MFERTKRFQRDDTRTHADNGGGVATTTQEPPPPPPATARERATATTADDAVLLDREARIRQRDEFGGINWGAAFFGWVVAIGIGVLLTAIVSAIATSQPKKAAPQLMPPKRSFASSWPAWVRSTVRSRACVGCVCWSRSTTWARSVCVCSVCTGSVVVCTGVAWVDVVCGAVVCGVVV